MSCGNHSTAARPELADLGRRTTPKKLSDSAHQSRMGLTAWWRWARYPVSKNLEPLSAILVLLNSAIQTQGGWGQPPHRVRHCQCPTRWGGCLLASALRWYWPRIVNAALGVLFVSPDLWPYRSVHIYYKIWGLVRVHV